MAKRRTVLTQFLTELEHLADAVTRITPELLTAWHHQANQDHSGGYKPISYEPAVKSSKEPPAPSLDRDDKHIEAELRKVWENLRNARVSLDWIGRTAYARVTPTTRMPDPEPQRCKNPTCPEDDGRGYMFSMIGTDRPHNHTGRCEGCRKFTERDSEGRERTRRRGGIAMTPEPAPRKGTINA